MSGWRRPRSTSNGATCSAPARSDRSRAPRHAARFRPRRRSAPRRIARPRARRPWSALQPTPTHGAPTVARQPVSGRVAVASLPTRSVPRRSPRSRRRRARTEAAPHIAFHCHGWRPPRSHDRILPQAPLHDPLQRARSPSANDRARRARLSSLARRARRVELAAATRRRGAASRRARAARARACRPVSTSKHLDPARRGVRQLESAKRRPPSSRRDRGPR